MRSKPSSSSPDLGDGLLDLVARRDAGSAERRSGVAAAGGTAARAAAALPGPGRRRATPGGEVPSGDEQMGKGLAESAGEDLARPPPSAIPAWLASQARRSSPAPAALGLDRHARLAPGVPAERQEERAGRGPVPRVGVLEGVGRAVVDLPGAAQHRGERGAQHDEVGAARPEQRLREDERALRPSAPARAPPARGS